MLRLALAAVLCVLVGAGTAAGASLAEPGEYLARHGLAAPPTSYEKVDHLDIDIGDESAQAVGVFTPGSIKVLDDLGPLETIATTMHEWGHAVSSPAWDKVSCGLAPAYCSREFVRWYEEGLVEAWALAHLPTYARWLLGRRMSLENVASFRKSPTYPEAFLWLDMAAAVTGCHRWSAQVREQLNLWLLATPDERMAAEASALPAWPLRAAVSAGPSLGGSR